jgi:hypothetical protein
MNWEKVFRNLKFKLLFHFKPGFLIYRPDADQLLAVFFINIRASKLYISMAISKLSTNIHIPLRKKSLDQFFNFVEDRWTLINDMNA